MKKIFCRDRLSNILVEEGSQGNIQAGTLRYLEISQKYFSSCIIIYIIFKRYAIKFNELVQIQLL